MMQLSHKFLPVLVAVAFLFGAASVAVGSVRVYEDERRELKLGIKVQVWTAYSHGIESPYETGVDRADMYLRRARLGLSGSVLPGLTFKMNFAFDGIGKDRFTVATGTAQDDDNKAFYLWDAIFNWQIDAEWLSLTFGYFRPQVGRESITSSSNVNSLTKALASSYVRKHIVGRSTGRETGVNVGGLHRTGWGSVNYNVGVFDTNHESIAGKATGGVNWRPLTTGRLAISLGDPELEEYGIGYKVNYFNRRKGITAGLNFTYQGGTDEIEKTDGYYNGFESNSLLGFDVLANWGGLNTVAEYDLLSRRYSEEFQASRPDEIFSRDYRSTVWHARMGCNFPLSNGQTIEPAALYSRYDTDEDYPYWGSMTHTLVQAGVNWYINGNSTKVNLFYGLWDNALPWRAGGVSPSRTGTNPERTWFLTLGVQLSL